MIKKLLFIILLLCMLTPAANAAMSYGASNYRVNLGSVNSGVAGVDPVYDFINEVEGIIEAMTIEDGDTVTFSTYSGTFGQSANNVFTWTETPVALENLSLTFAADAVTWSSSTGVTSMSLGTMVLDLDQIKSAAVTYTLPTTDGSAGQQLTTNASGVLTWAASGAGTFTGGSITSDITLSDDVDILPTTTITDTWSIQVYDTDAPGYLDVLRWTNATTPTVVLGAATSSFSLASTGLDISTAGAISNATTIGASGTVTAGGVAAGTLTSSGVTTIGDGTATVAINTSGWGISTAGVISGITGLTLTDLTLTGDITMANGKVIKGSTTTAQTIALQVYDNDTGPGYKNAILLTNGNTPAIAIGDDNPTVAIDSSDWDISTSGVMTGIGAITSDGLFTGTGGITATGTISINDSATTSTTSIGGGTTTGAITIGGTGTQAVNIGNGAGIKTVALGSSNTSSTTTILGGSNGVNINVGALDDPTNINTGVNTGTVTIGGTGAMSIAIGDGGTGAKTITIGDAAGAGSTVIKAGTGNLELSAVDDVSLNGGSGGSIIGIGQNTHGNVIQIGQDDTNADTITIGSAKDTSSLVGIAVTLGSTGTTSATTVTSGSGGVNVNASNNQPTNINTGTSTGTVTVGNALATFALASTGLDISTAGVITNADSIAGTNGNTIDLDTNQKFSFTDNSETLTLDVGTVADTLTLSSATGIVTIDFGAVDAFTGVGTIAFDAAAASITTATDGAAQDLTIGITGATDSSLILSSTGTAADAISITASGTAGGITLNAGTAGITCSDDAITDIGDIHVDTIYNEADTDITYSTKTVTVTIDMNSVDTANSDFQWDNTASNQAQQNLDLGALVPAWCEFVSMYLRCYEAVDDTPTFNFEIGTASSGNQIAADAEYDTLHAFYSTAAAGSPVIAVTAAARNIWIGATPDANWDTLEQGKWVVSVTYIDYGAAYTAHSKK